MLMMIVRLIFMGTVIGAAMTANPNFIFAAIIPTILVFLRDGKEGILFWGGLPLGILWVLSVLG